MLVISSVTLPGRNLSQSAGSSLIQTFLNSRRGSDMQTQPSKPNQGQTKVEYSWVARGMTIPWATHRIVQRKEATGSLWQLPLWHSCWYKTAPLCGWHLHHTGKCQHALSYPPRPDHKVLHMSGFLNTTTIGNVQSFLLPLVHLGQDWLQWLPASLRDFRQGIFLAPLELILRLPAQEVSTNSRLLTRHKETMRLMWGRGGY